MDPAEPSPDSGFRRARILVVEDDAAVRRTLEALLAARGWVVENAADGQAALDVLQQRVPDLVVMDMVMPGGGGLESLSRLRGDPRTRCVPVVMISGLSDDEARAEALEAGASDFLIKPFHEGDLV